MKSLLIALILCVSSRLSYSQDKLPDLLQDASYVMNRFDEITTGFDVEIQSWTVDDSSKQIFRQELQAVLRNANFEKPRLTALLGKSDVSSADLFDVYSELQSIGAELETQASRASFWGSEARSIELVQLSAKTEMLAAKIR